MRRAMTGFTLLELLIVIAIIGILAAVLIPNLLNARARAFDTGAQACLKEVGTMQEVFRADAPFVYVATFDPTTVATCVDVTFTVQNVTNTFYTYEASHDNGVNTYRVQTNTSVIKVP